MNYMSKEEAMRVMFLLSNIREWANKRGFSKVDRKLQLLKMVEEIGELSKEVLLNEFNKQKELEIKNELADLLHAIIIFIMISGYKIDDLLESAYMKNLNRNGAVKKGVYIREEEPKKEE